MASNNNEVLVRIRGLTFHRGSRAIFDGVDIDIRRGAVTAIMGPSGTGKTTLLKLITRQLRADAGTIDAPIGRSPRHPTRMAVTDEGRPAVTHYRVEDRFAEPATTARLRCELATGRTHQIRVHLRAIGHPVVGDREYDGGRPGIDPGRPFLHAGELRFAHPTTGAPIEARSPLPAELEAILADCR